MEQTIETIIRMLDSNGFDSFECWFGQSEAKTSDHSLLVAATQIWEMDCWTMADKGFTFDQTVKAVDHMMLNVGAY